MTLALTLKIIAGLSRKRKTSGNEKKVIKVNLNSVRYYLNSFYNENALNVPIVGNPRRRVCTLGGTAINAKESDMLKGYRTYVMAALGVISAVASYLVGAADLVTAANAAFTAGALAFLRASVPRY